MKLIKLVFSAFISMIANSIILRMANEYNITPANFARNDDFLFLDDPEMHIKVLGDPAWTEFKPFGYAELEKSFSIDKEYAEFKTGIPETLVAKTAISVKRTFECKLKQLQPEILALLQQAIIEAGSGENYVHIGSEPPTQLNLAVILKGKTLNGKNLELRIRKLIPSPESVKIALGSKEYASLDFKGDVVVDEDPLYNNFSWRCYGEVSTTAGITSADDDITVASATGIEVGMYAYGAGIPQGATVSGISGTTVTLSANATATGASVAVKFVTAENMLKSDVAYWICEAAA
jgi:hypothetical protein